MSFKTLEQRFNERVEALYGGAETRFSQGKPSTGKFDEPYLTRRPGDGQFGLASEGRGLPFVSGPRDVKRLTKFQLSGKGIRFLAQQQVLQTGNTFEFTRVLNPTFVVGNAIPFLHIKRNARPLDELFQKTDTSYGNVKRMGQLQRETFNSFQSPNSSRNLLQRLSDSSIASPISNTISGFTADRNIRGGDGDEYWAKSRPELAETYHVFNLSKSNWDSGKPQALNPQKWLNLNLNMNFDPVDPWRSGTADNFTNTVDVPTPLGEVIIDTRRQLDYSSKPGFKYGGKLTTVDFPGWSYGFFNDKSENGEYEPRSYLNSTGRDAVAFTVSDYSPIILSWRADTPNTRLVYRKDVNIANTARSGKLSKTAQKRLVQRDSAGAGGTGKEAIKGQEEWQKYQDAVTKDETEDSRKGSLSEQPFLRYFTPGAASVRAVIAAQTGNDPEVRTANAKTQAESNRNSPYEKVSYIKDPLNLAARPEIPRTHQSYKDLVKPVKDDRSNDPIIVSFAMGKKEDSVQFRAFISDLTQNASPNYKEYQYIGRIERFISYISVKRSITFKLGVLAFSKDELDIVWKRINYLTGTVYPYGFNKGILQPNIIRLSIGNLYIDQPGYITSLNTDFNNPAGSWDIDREVPIGATMDISFDIIEKDTKIAESPLYGINENGDNGFIESVTPGATNEQTRQSTTY